jgi:hypothetical protein
VRKDSLGSSFKSQISTVHRGLESWLEDQVYSWRFRVGSLLVWSLLFLHDLEESIHYHHTLLYMEIKNYPFKLQS